MSQTKTQLVEGLNINTSAPADTLAIDNNGRVGIGTSSPGSPLNVQGADEVEGDAHGTLILEDTAAYNANPIAGVIFRGEHTSGSKAYFSSVYGGKENASDGNYSGYLAFATRVSGSTAAERMRIDSSGRLLVGTTSGTSAQAIITDGLQVTGAASDGNSGRATLDYTSGGARLMGHNSSGEGSIKFLANASGSGVTTKMTILGSGDVGIGTTSPGYRLEVKSGTAQYAFSNTGSNPRLGLFYNDTPENAEIHSYSLKFFTGGSTAFGGTERMRIKNDGRAVIGGSFTTSYGQVFTAVKADDGGMYFGIGDQGNSANAWSRVSGTTTYTHIQFANPNGSIGSITTNGASTAYNTSSDYRLKENVVDLDGAITRIKQLAPKRFNFISDETDTLVDGFLAHEAQVVVPEAVTGTHNEVDDDGNAVMQGIDQSKLVPLLTAALQEAIGKIEALETANASQAATIAAFEARLTALEGAG